jgi:hypothetical protein
VNSYGAVLLTLPALVAILAADRLKNGFSNANGLFDQPAIALQTFAIPILVFVVMPALVMALFWGVARTANGTRFVIAWNWTEVMVTLMLAFPAALFAAGLLKPAMAFATTLAFALIAARLRYAVARSTLGVGAPLALGVVSLSFLVEIGATMTFAIGRF